MDERTYLYRRQFVFGPRYITRFPDWNKVEVDNRHILTVHPDLKITKVEWDGNVIILLGYILDPNNTEFDDYHILESISRKITTANDIFSEVFPMGGRYVIIAKVKDDLRIFSDANGMRQVFYCKHENNEFWCGSEPSVLADSLNLTVDKEIRDDLFKLSFFSKKTEYWYPGKLTIYRTIYHLTPNHYIDLACQEVKRFWPSELPVRLSFDNTINKCVFFLQHLIEAAHNRFNLALGLSAGYDSRIVLAASKNVSPSLLYFTHTVHGKHADADDIRIPSELCRILKLQHVIIDIPDKMDLHFESLFNKNVITARKSKGLNINGLHNYFSKNSVEYVLTSGNMSEISKRNARRLPRLPNVLINQALLTLFAEMQGSSLAENSFGEWFTKYKNDKYCNNLDVLDMFYWEQRMAKWAAMTFSEMDIAFENFCPFNCRELLSCMIGIPLYYRSQPDYIFHTELIKRMWPDTMRLPVNPAQNNITRLTRYLVFKTRIYDMLKYFYLITIKKNRF